MEMQDPREQVKIWQRTRPVQASVTEGLQPLAAAALATASVYGSLVRQLQGTQRELAVQLREQQLGTVRCLKGIYRMATGNPMQVGSSTPAVETAEAALRKNYGRSLKSLSAYESRSADSEYGAVFEALAVREREHCRKLTELMGMLQV